MNQGRLAWLRAREMLRTFQRKHFIRLALILMAACGLVWLGVNLPGRPAGQLENVSGVVESAFTSGQKAPGYMSVTVRLDTGFKVPVHMPEGLPFIRDARVELAVDTYATGFGLVYRYRFIRYYEASTGSSP